MRIVALERPFSLRQHLPPHPPPPHPSLSLSFSLPPLPPTLHPKPASTVRGVEVYIVNDQLLLMIQIINYRYLSMIRHELSESTKQVETHKARASGHKGAARGTFPGQVSNPDPR